MCQLFFLIGIMGTKEYRQPEWVTQMEEMREALKGMNFLGSFYKHKKDTQYLIIKYIYTYIHTIICTKYIVVVIISLKYGVFSIAHVSFERMQLSPFTQYI